MSCLSPQSCNQVGSTKRGLKNPRGCDESLIAEFMAKFVVDTLHAVEIDEGQCDAVPIALCELQLLFRNRYEAVPIVEPGKRVRERETLQRGHEPVALTGVTDDPKQQRSINLLLYEIVLRALLKGSGRQLLVMSVVKHDNRGCVRCMPDMAHGFHTGQSGSERSRRTRSNLSFTR